MTDIAQPEAPALDRYDLMARRFMVTIRPGIEGGWAYIPEFPDWDHDQCKIITGGETPE